MSARRSVEALDAAINDAATLVWNGPLGAFEIPPFDQGTVAAARHAAERTKAGKLVSVAGGGDTVAALNHAGVADDFTYVSTAGGAFLEWIEGKPLPGVDALRPKAFREGTVVRSARHRLSYGSRAQSHAQEDEMARITMRQLLDHAAEKGYGVPAFNINNMEQALAIMAAASEAMRR